MIMQRRREERATATSRISKDAIAAPARSALLTKGRAELNVPEGTFEIVFAVPAEEAIPLIEKLKSASASTPIRLWLDANGNAQASLRPDGSAGSRATFTVRTDPEAPASARPEMPRLVVGEFVINPGRHEVLYKGKPTPKLTYTEFGILYLLARHPGWVFNRNQIIEGVRGANYPVTDRAVDVQVAGLRRKLGEGAEWIETVRGIGYRFRD